MRLAHVSDFHITKLTCNPFRLFPKRIFSHLHWIACREKKFSVEPIAKLPELFSKLGVDLALLGGDFTSTSMPEEFEKAQAIMQQFQMPYLAIPGNHDNYTYLAQKQKLYYKYFKNSNTTLGSLAKDGVEATKIAPLWWVVSLDTSFPNYQSQGMFSEKTEAHLKNILETIPSQEKIILFNHYPLFQQESKSRSLQRAKPLEQLVRKMPQIVFYLHGHTHRHCVADLRESGFPILLDSGSCGQTENGTFNLLDIKDKGCSIATFTWEGDWKQTKTQEFVW
jgi:3',5'-cyclic AMP phosphodiesterase CpdA